MIDESNLLNFYCSGVYDTTKAMTQTEIIMKIIEKLNLIILNFNDLDNQLTKRVKELEKQVNYYIESGIKIEGEKQIDAMVKNGSIKRIINDVIVENYS